VNTLVARVRFVVGMRVVNSRVVLLLLEFLDELTVLTATRDFESRHALVDGASSGDAGNVGDTRDGSAVNTKTIGTSKGGHDVDGAATTALEVVLGVDTFPIPGTTADDAACFPAGSAGALSLLTPVDQVTLLREGASGGGGGRALRASVYGLLRVTAATTVVTHISRGTSGRRI